jgi:hypothetical protein
VSLAIRGVLDPSASREPAGPTETPVKRHGFESFVSIRVIRDPY